MDCIDILYYIRIFFYIRSLQSYKLSTITILFGNIYFGSLNVAIQEYKSKHLNVGTLVTYYKSIVSDNLYCIIDIAKYYYMF